VIVEPARIGALGHIFNRRVASADLSPRSRPLASIEAELAEHIGELARNCGWSHDVRTSFEAIDLVRVREFPTHNHLHGCIVRVAGRTGEVVLNRNALELGYVATLMSRLPPLIWLFGKALEQYPMLSGEFPCFLGDVSYWPNIAYSGNHPDAFLIPDSEFFATSAYQAFKTAMETAPSWDDRIPKIFWRGSTSGIKRYWPPRSGDDVAWLPRLELCARALRPPLAAVCDIGFTNLVQIPDDWASELGARIAHLRRPPVPKQDFARFRGVIDIDGNSNAWSGLFTSLLSGACVIKVDSELGFAQWYYDRLEAGVHYLPVKSDLSDLESAVDTVLTNEAAARRIAAAGCAFARSLNLDDEAFAAVNRLIARASMRSG
jgi:hypothetical protein